ncbi:cohesin domain-containing protein [Natronorubrum aibiense]|uniref:Cohesin domain-containing protein n=1 Tax=Natronorubrum aibiense TaxID=348826 RepID=A0A5P9P6I6_9EURY|nr:cohesin domain-containing protein [Natronorubrum aibiense]QFU83791.1 hypothetical protein GCU68_15225 [Natronorubrum aibiense]
MMGARRGRLSAVLVAVVICACTLGAVAPVVDGADNATTLYFEPSKVDADAGETVTFELVASSHGDYVGDGIDELSLTLAYDSDVFTVTDVEHGPMLAAGDSDAEVDGTAEIDDAASTVTIEQARTPSGNGAKATETAATITLEVAEDAPSTTETVEITDATAMLVSDYPQASVERGATITIDGTDGGDDPVSGFTLPAALFAVGAVLLVAVRRWD